MAAVRYTQKPVGEARTRSPIDQFAAERFLVMVDASSSTNPFVPSPHAGIVGVPFPLELAVLQAQRALEKQRLRLELVVGGNGRFTDGDNGVFNGTVHVRTNALDLPKSELYILRTCESGIRTSLAEEVEPETIGLLRANGDQLAGQELVTVFEGRAGLGTLSRKTGDLSTDLKLLVACTHPDGQLKRYQSMVIVLEETMMFTGILRALINENGSRTFIARIGEEGNRLVALVSMDYQGKPIIQVRKLSSGQHGKMMGVWGCDPEIPVGTEVMIHPAEFVQVLRYAVLEEVRGCAERVAKGGDL